MNPSLPRSFFERFLFIYLFIPHNGADNLLNEMIFILVSTQHARFLSPHSSFPSQSLVPFLHTT